MPKKLLTTPRSRVRSAIRQLWLRSRERSAALKAQNYCCQSCGKKQSKAKGKEQAVEVHHKNGIGNWDAVIDIIYEQILCSPATIEVLCPECHREIEQIRHMKEKPEG
jgi:hypothetical protein